MTDAERRLTAVRVEVRAASDKQTIGGYAAKFNFQSRNLGGFVERVDPNAFAKSRGDGWPEVIARYNHDDNMVLGTSRAGTLRLDTDGVGLRYDVDLPTSRADVYELVSRGDVSQSSFAFIPFEDDWATTDQGFPLRSLLSVRLLDVAPVNTPAYEDSTVGLRGIDGAYASLARKFDADVTEVRNLASANDLVKFFRRTDGVSAEAEKKKSAQAALARALARG